MSRKRKHKAKPKASIKAGSIESTLDATSGDPVDPALDPESDPGTAPELATASAAPDEEVLAEGSGPVEAAMGEADALASALASASGTPSGDAVAADSGDVDVVVREVEEERVADDEALHAMEQPVETLADDLERRMDGEAIDGEAIDGEAIDPVATLPTSAATMDASQLKQLVEALVFASDKPITVVRLRQLTRISDTRRLEHALAELAEDYRDRGLVLQQVSGGYQFRTRTQWAGWVQQLIAGRPVRLSRAQLETLAIIAYRQPITRPEIDEIRGVDSSATLKLLMDRALIRILGKKEEVGRPMLYGTTKEFLDFFSLGDLRELPTLREYSELTDESRQVMTDRLGAAPNSGDDDGGEGGNGGDSGGGAPPSAGFEPESGGDVGLGATAEIIELEDMIATMGRAAEDDEDDGSSELLVDGFVATMSGEISASELIAAMRVDSDPGTTAGVAFDPGAHEEATASVLISAIRATVEVEVDGGIGIGIGVGVELEVERLEADSLDAFAVTTVDKATESDAFASDGGEAAPDDPARDHTAEPSD